MLKHQNPEELADDEVKEGEILPPSLDPDQFPAETDIEIFVSDGHVNWAQMSNFLRAGMFFIPACLLASSALIGFAFTDFPSVSEVARWALRMEPAESGSAAPKASDSRSFLGRGAYSLFGWDPDTAITLPDGQKVSVQLAFLSQLPPARAGEMNADGFRKLIDDYKASLVRTPSPDEQELARAKEHVARLEENSQWNTEAWNLQYRIQTLGKTIVTPSEIPTVSAQGFWQTESNLDKMASDGVIATDNGNFFAAAYIGGVPAVSMFTPSACYTILGVGYEGCEPLSKIEPFGVNHIRETLFGDTPEQIAAAPGKAEEKAVGEEDRWYLDFPLLADTSTLSQADLDTLFKAVDANVRLPNGITLHTTITSAVSALPAPVMAAPAKGLLKNPAAIEAMRHGGVVGTTDVPGRVVVAAYIDNKVQIRIRTEGGLCRTVFGDNAYGCPTDDFGRNVEFQDLVKSLYDQPDTPGQALNPYFWFADAPMVAATSMDGNDIVRMLNAALQDVANYGGADKDAVAKWTKTPKLKHPPLITRPEGFFAKAENVAALGAKGAVIIPKDLKDTFLLAANYQGHLNLDVIEILPNGRWNCTAVFGPVRQPIPECKANDLTKYDDIIRSMFGSNPGTTAAE